MKQGETMATHRPETVLVLGYEKSRCAACEEYWPCHEAVKEACERCYLDEGLGCECGWHDEEGRTTEPVEWSEDTGTR